MEIATCFARIIYHIILQLGISEIMTNNFNPWSYVISVCQWCLVKNVVSTKYVVDISRLSSYCIILNHPVTWLIILTSLIFKISSFLCIHITQVPIISTNSLFHGISSASLAGNLPFFYLIVLYVDKCHNWLLIFGQRL